MYFTIQCFERAITDAQTLRSLFVNIYIFSVTAVALRAYSFHKCILISGTYPRNLESISRLQKPSSHVLKSQGEDFHIKGAGMLVGNFELNP